MLYCVNTMHKQDTTNDGFTLVELLIVIVVIAILATISIVAYTNIQRRAENAKTISGVTQYVTILHSYKVLNGDYPTTAGGGRYSCLGTGYAGDVCHVSDGSEMGVNDDAFNAAVRTVASSLPQLSTKMLTISGTQSTAGGSFHYNSKMIRYHLAGTNQECSAGGTGYSYNGTTTQCRIILD